MAKRRQRRMFTAAESAEVWDRWQRGEGLKLIGRVLGRTSSAIFAHLKPHGGIRPAVRRRSRRVLSMDEREEISRGIPDELLKSLTWDRGKEMAQHKRFTLATDAAVYFCDPQSPWQRGSNENTNGLLRQYFPKGTNLSAHSQKRLDEIAQQLNQRPRKTLGFETPAERFEACVAMTD